MCWHSFHFFFILVEKKRFCFAAKAKILSPESVKKVQNFSTGIINHVKNYYNSSLWQTLTPQAEKRELPAHPPSEDDTPVPATPFLGPTCTPSSAPPTQASPSVAEPIPSAQLFKETSTVNIRSYDAFANF